MMKRPCKSHTRSCGAERGQPVRVDLLGGVTPARAGVSPYLRERTSGGGRGRGLLVGAGDGVCEVGVVVSPCLREYPGQVT